LTVSTINIWLAWCRCSIALVAQFYPQKHPDSWWLLFFCVIAYAACTAALNLFLLRFEGETFFFTRAKRVGVLSQSSARLSCKHAHTRIICTYRSSSYYSCLSAMSHKEQMHQLVSTDLQHPAYGTKSRPRSCFLQDTPALKFVARMPRYSDQYTLLISQREDKDHPQSVFQLMPWVAVLQSLVPGLKPESSPQR